MGKRQKTGRGINQLVPNALWPFVDEYLRQHRKILLRFRRDGSTTSALWITANGDNAADHQIRKVVNGPRHSRARCLGSMRRPRLSEVPHTRSYGGGRQNSSSIIRNGDARSRHPRREVDPPEFHHERPQHREPPLDPVACRQRSSRRQGQEPWRPMPRAGRGIFRAR